MSDRGGRGMRGGGDRGRGGRGGGPGDWRGGGRGRGRGRGDDAEQGYRGGRGSSGFHGGDRGSGGGYRGEVGGYRGNRGGRGDGGGFQGGFRGPRGDGGRGGFRGGGRGGRGGGRDQSPGKEMAYSIDGFVPSPDKATIDLENRIMAAQSSSLAGLTSSMKELKTGDKDTAVMNHFPVRPAFGSNGRSIVLWANYFRINVKPVTFYKYTLELAQVPRESEATEGGGKTSTTKGNSREVKGRKLSRAIEKVLQELSTNNKTLALASEYKSQLITMQKLDLKPNPLQIHLPIDSNSDNFDVINVTIHGPSEVPVDGLLDYLNTMQDEPGDHVFPRNPDVVDALNVILGNRPRSQLDRISAVGNSRFFKFGDGEKIKGLFSSYHALVAARGAFQSVRLGTGGILLNTNVTHGIFRVSGRLNEIMDNLGIKAVPRDDKRGMRILKAFAKFLPKTRVCVTFTVKDGKQVRRRKTIHNLALSWEYSQSGDHPPRFQPGWEYAGPKNLSFWLESEGKGRYSTVYDYFRQKYRVTLGDYPLVNVGSTKRPVFFPAEVIEIEPGQSVKAKLTGDETTTMLDFACRSPYSNAISISADCRETLGLDDTEELDKFGLSVDKTLLTVHGRVLKAPVITYIKADGKSNDAVTPQNGSWNMRAKRVAKPSKMIERWSWVNVIMRERDQPVNQDVVTDFGTFMNNMMGVRINKKPVSPPKNFMYPNQIERLFQWAKGERIEFLLIILSDKDSTGLYGKIKTLGDCTYGIHTSCVVGSKFGKGQPAYFANVGLKWNLKAGGVNHKLREEFGVLKDGKTMIAGYDVTHPTNMPVHKGNEPPSLVGLVASIDRDLGQWPAVAWEQASKQEMLGDVLVDAFKSRLDLWEKHNRGQLPENIVIYRDGVSEGQYAQVLDKELPSIREAYKLKYPPKKQPKITIVVSVKRHQTRFYPTDKDDMSPSGNTPNGTVVDRGVTQVRYWDFFLTAHDALKGTARPAHYTVLLDEIFRAKHKDDAANQLERLTHDLCYLFGRATRAVSICPPAYYADMVCERARAHRPEYFDVSDTESVVSGSGPGSSVGGSGKQIHENLRDTMYYI